MRKEDRSGFHQWSWLIKLLRVYFSWHIRRERSKIQNGGQGVDILCWYRRRAQCQDEAVPSTEEEPPRSTPECHCPVNRPTLTVAFSAFKLINVILPVAQGWHNSRDFLDYKTQVQIKPEYLSVYSLKQQTYSLQWLKGRVCSPDICLVSQYQKKKILGNWSSGGFTHMGSE